MNDSAPDTMKHIRRVQTLLLSAVVNLINRGADHDASKLGPEEKPKFDEATSLWGMEFGSDEYKVALARLGPALAHHYANNSHHPEHYGPVDMGNPFGGIRGMNLLDLIEMLADWKAAGERHAGGSLADSIKKNAERFEMDTHLEKLLTDTARELGWL